MVFAPRFIQIEADKYYVFPFRSYLLGKQHALCLQKTVLAYKLMCLVLCVHKYEIKSGAQENPLSLILPMSPDFAANALETGEQKMCAHKIYRKCDLVFLFMSWTNSAHHNDEWFYYFFLRKRTRLACYEAGWGMLFGKKSAKRVDEKTAWCDTFLNWIPNIHFFAHTRRQGRAETIRGECQACKSVVNTYTIANRLRPIFIACTYHVWCKIKLCT